MQLKSLKLKNIRSYIDEVIEFPKGSVLLSGDIGSGKSSVLLGIEFALFGVRKPDLTGPALLRKGTREGTVELRFLIDKKDIIIKRVLKKTKNDIKQDAGFIIIDGVKTEGTAVELKARVLDILGYPKDLLTKHKDIIYRYTVYTPQEEMKAILFEDRHLRLNTLRKVFGIDKYKIIRENCLIYIRELKNRNRESAGSIYDLNEKLDQLKTRNQEHEDYEKKIKNLLPKTKKAKEDLKQKKSSILNIEKQIRELNKHKKDLEILDNDLKNKLEQRMKNKSELDDLKKVISQIEETLPKEIQDIDKIIDKIRKTEKWISDNEKEDQDIQKKISEIEISIKTSDDISEKITRLDTCPTCEQNVSDDYKKIIKERENSKIIKIKDKLEILIKKQTEIKDILSKHKSQLMVFRDEEKELMIVNEKIKSLLEKKESLQKINKEQERSKKDIGDINKEKMLLKKQIESSKDSEKKYNNAQKELIPLEKIERDLDMEINGIQNKKEEIEKSIDLLLAETNKKLEIKQQIRDILALINWLEEYFINLMITMEKHVMSQLYREFNEYFIEWFHSLIEDEAISAKLNDEFSPVIQQNGYDTELEHLSGGEKTSVALAYRLALNKVINDFISHIKTSDLIILDEPTDGFSDQQLDRVRELLENLNIPQIIVVSHETKIETFVDSIIRITKSEHVSKISKTF